jgi:hypothetical protein
LTIFAGVEKDDRGQFYAWFSKVADPGKKYPHLVLYFRDNSAVSAFKPGTKYTIRGVCAGKKGIVETHVAGVWQDYPSVVFKDCEFVK